MKKIWISVALVLATLVGATACTTDADVASKNISNEADNFRVLRQIVFVNGVTDQYLLEIKGWCNISVDKDERQLEVTCKRGENAYYKDFFGLSDNAPYFVHQLETSNVSTNFFQYSFKPTTVIPDINFE